MNTLAMWIVFLQQSALFVLYVVLIALVVVICNLLRKK